MPTVSAHVALTLAQHIDAVFGVMGNGNAYFLDAIETQTDAVFTAVRHEQGAVVAADAHFRASGRIAAGTSTYGAGFTNTLTALAEAVQAHVPLVLVVGDEPTSGPRPWDVDQIALASAVGARTYTVGRADAAATTVIAIEHALTYRVPVVLAIPYDVAALEAGEVPEAPSPRIPAPLAPRGEFADAMLDEIAAALAGAERPFLLAGRGAWLSGASSALGELAAATGALTASSALGRGVFPDTRYDLGVTGGFGADGAMELVRSADVAVVFGAALNQFTMRFGELFAPGTRVFQIDTAPAATHAHVGGFVRADARLAAEELVARIGTAGSAHPWRETVDVAAARTYDAGDDLAPDGRLDPRSAARRIAELLPEDRVVVSDGGHFIGWANMYWPVAAPDRMMMVGTAFQSIGQGWPSVVGAALARRESTVVLTSGDGGGLMAIADLESAVRAAGGRGMAVVWNDAAYGAEVNLYGLKGLAEGPMRIPEVDFAAFGAAVGAEGVVVRTLSDLDRLASWAEEDTATRRFLLLDLRISGDVIAPYQQEIIRVNS
ncbi:MULTISPECIES: thiamine pyrophosphate-binding protein [Microbacterium]|jgi:thiamine pyrophosphate-dependent acetolactate synthase large subunit-like protein|uniref:Acetolactate synthase I/II/III large subunit n=1 Tax=Microbacterium maritypicum TaxID=33918 RepID=A0A4Y4B804_MICMQ|nr:MULTISPECIES: thiamine pyrophosphate-binding protein [Microbacterium]AZS46487.1 Acetolactate synthase isozyme 3 large subunit [Microbacterium oxydans]KAB1883822.1 thiamine pyrophosphate-binding protein [Microbacterium liquefaciens]KQY74668.1 thiamine pyrophosphate-binding protein [Microbacterium sp. Root1433D1]QYG11626.1 thiamine pyrophosphate-binding protein [Microbacterium sp. PAMC22086]WKT88037.1 thiamine pyrophosphate-binding protein [Microbacterium liquefaciens]